MCLQQQWSRWLTQDWEPSGNGMPSTAPPPFHWGPWMAQHFIGLLALIPHEHEGHWGLPEKLLHLMAGTGSTPSWPAQVPHWWPLPTLSSAGPLGYAYSSWAPAMPPHWQGAFHSRGEALGCAGREDSHVLVPCVRWHTHHLAPHAGTQVHYGVSLVTGVVSYLFKEREKLWWAADGQCHGKGYARGDCLWESRNSPCLW